MTPFYNEVLRELELEPLDGVQRELFRQGLEDGGVITSQERQVLRQLDARKRGC